VRKRAAIAFTVLFATIAGLIGWQAIRVSEPIYQGQPLSTWLIEYERSMSRQGPPSQPPATDPGRAIYEIGTNAVPLLLGRLRAHDSPLAFQIKLLARLSPSSLHHIRLAQELHREGFIGFRALGPRGEIAIPELVNMLNEQSDPSIAENAIHVLVGFHDEAVVPVLIEATTNANPRVRKTAVLDLGYRRSQAEGVVQSLLNRLGDDDAIVRSTAAISLGKFPGQPDLIVPALVVCLRDTNSSVQESAAQSLGYFGANARAAVPRLVEMVEARGPGCVAAGALRSIDPAAAQQAGLCPTTVMPSFE
jgi:hypothetical protein